MRAFSPHHTAARTNYYKRRKRSTGDTSNLLFAITLYEAVKGVTFNKNTRSYNKNFLKAECGKSFLTSDHADKFITGNALKNLFISSEQVSGTRLTLITDMRATPIGRLLLRKTSLRLLALYCLLVMRLP